MATRIVHFHEYCKKCKFEKTSETEEPCDDCLTNGGNEDSHKPVHYEPKEGR